MKLPLSPFLISCQGTRSYWVTGSQIAPSPQKKSVASLDAVCFKSIKSQDVSWESPSVWRPPWPNIELLFSQTGNCSSLQMMVNKAMVCQHERVIYFLARFVCAFFGNFHFNGKIVYFAKKTVLSSINQSIAHQKDASYWHEMVWI